MQGTGQAILGGGSVAMGLECKGASSCQVLMGFVGFLFVSGTPKPEIKSKQPHSPQSKLRFCCAGRV